MGVASDRELWELDFLAIQGFVKVDGWMDGYCFNLYILFSIYNNNNNNCVFILLQ